MFVINNGGTCFIIVLIVGNELSNLSSNPAQDCLHFHSCYLIAMVR